MEDLDQTYNREGKVLSEGKRALTPQQIAYKKAVALLRALRQKGLAEWTAQDVKEGLLALMVLFKLGEET